MEEGVKLDRHQVKDRSENMKLDEVAEPNSSQDLVVDGVVKQRRYFGSDGQKIVDIDFSHPGS
ncbi:hypothetical protein [Veillonella agrestimuris]|uniref:hypothetical protein n=1 Tax=Veillonella agrestimuris TaxID=2941340 RepID=UPI00203D9F0C|nr:hypothetical protein [Veillonella agrestimuris]